MRGFRINKQGIFWTYMLLPFLMPEFVYFNKISSSIFVLWKLTNLVFIALLFVKKRVMIDKLLWPVIALQLWFVVSGIIHGKISLEFLQTLTIVLIFYYGLKKKPRVFFRALLLICEILVIANFVSMILYPDGLYTKQSDYQVGIYYLNWFLGYKNSLIRMILPLCLFEFIYNNKKKTRRYIFNLFTLREFVFYAISAFSLLMSSSMNGIVAILLFFVGIVYIRIMNRYSFLNPKKFSLVSLAVAYGVVILNIQNYFSYFIGVVLNRDVGSMAGRDVVWNKAIDIILERPLIGWGSYSETLLNVVGVSHPHNIYLYILVNGGMVGLVLFFVIISNLKTNRNEDKELACVNLVIIVFLVMGLTESLTGMILLYPIIVMNLFGNQIWGENGS